MLYVLYMSKLIYISLTPLTNPTPLKSVLKSPNCCCQKEKKEYDTSPEKWKYLTVDALVTDLI